MTDQPTPNAEKPSPVQKMTPDWQQIALLLLWKFLPATERTIAIFPQDFTDLMAAYGGLPVITFQPGESATVIGLVSESEAMALADAYNLEINRKHLDDLRPAPGTETLQ